jgi:hypothetical protein
MKRKKASAVARVPTDTERLDALGKTSGFVCGSFEGAPSYRILGRSAWHPTLRCAIDELLTTTQESTT